MVKLTRRAVCAAGLSSFMLTNFAARSAWAADGNKSTLRLAATKAPSRLDPHIDVKWEVLMILSAIYDTLVYQTPEGKFVPGLATAWTVSDDGLSYEFDLREGVTFHDGTPFDAEVVKFNIERIQGLGAKSFKAASLISDVDSAEVVSPTRVRLKMKQPNGSMLFNLSLTFLAMVSPAAVKKWGDEYHLHQIGTGPYKISEFVVGDHYTLVRNEDYAWAPETFAGTGAGLIGTLRWGFLPEPASRAVSLMAGDYDVVFDLQPTSLRRIQADSQYQLIYSHLTGQPAYWFLNTTLAPTDDPAVRKAMITGLDMAAAVKSIMRGTAPQAHGPLSAVTPEYAPEVAKMYPHDRKAAIAMLEKAGWTDSDGDGIREKDGQKLSLKVQMAGWGNSEPFSVFLQSELKKMGFDVSLEMMSYPVGMEAGRKGTHNLLFTGGSGFSASDSMIPYFASANTDSGFAFSKYRDPDLDALLNKAEATSDPQERRTLYQQAQVRVMDNALILPIYDYSLTIGASKKVKGLTFGATGLVPNLHDVSL